jgi:cytochrome c-type biogenesis protein
MTAAQITTLSLTAIGLAFAAGLLSFVSPCVLPLLPVYLSFISGVGIDDLGGQRRRLLWTSLLFVAGFTVVFVLMGAGAGGVGRLLSP